jgi:hypothetical protein
VLLSSPSIKIIEPIFFIGLASRIFCGAFLFEVYLGPECRVAHEINFFDVQIASFLGLIITFEADKQN